VEEVGTGLHRAETDAERAELAGALVTLLARALHLERAVLLMEEVPGGALVAVARHGGAHIDRLQRDEPPEGGPWSSAIPIRSGADATGLLLLARAGGAPLAPRDLALAQRLAEGAARLAEHGRMAADLASSRELLARADRLSALGMLAAGVAHEIRNPLVSVRTFIQLLPERLSDEEFRTTFRDLALAEIERICALINDLLAFARPPAQRESTDLNELAAQIIRLLDAEARKRDVAVVCRGDATLPRVVVDDAQVKQVLMNVILNAIEACEPHGSVVVVTRTEESRGERWCAVIVADSGSGIAPEHVEQIFDPFFTTKNEGSGLGLFIARQIVDEHGGYITTASRPGGGTEFAVHFPLAARVADVDAG